MHLDPAWNAIEWDRDLALRMLQKIRTLLGRRGYSLQDIHGIMYVDWLTVFRPVWKGAKTAATHRVALAGHTVEPLPKRNLRADLAVIECQD
jgi:hypothetical protein